MSSATNQTTQKVNVTTPLDRIGQLINLHRLPNESLKAFKLRVLDNYIHPANASYGGLYNGISRELGQAAYTGGIIIDVERVDGVPIVSDRFALSVDERGILANSVMSASGLDFQTTWDGWPDERWETPEFDYIATWGRTDSYFLIDLLIALNAIPGLEAISWGTALSFDKSEYLKKISSVRSLHGVPVNGTNLQTFYTQMTDSNWITSAVFSRDSGVTEEVDNIEDLEGCGDFAVPDFGRTIHTLTPPMVGTIDILFSVFPLIIPMSTVEINTLTDPDTMDILTEQNLDVFGDNQDGILSVTGADYANELLSVVPMYYGE